MSNALDRIVNVSIDINRAPATVDAYEHLLIIGPGPAKAPEKPPAPIGSYTDLDAVAAAGWVTSGDNADPVGVAARLAFTQAKKPAYIYIAVQQTSEAGLEDIDATVQRALGNIDWWAICPAGIAEENYQKIADAIENTERCFLYTYCSNADPVAGEKFRSAGFIGLTSMTAEQPAATAPNRFLSVAATVAALLNKAGSETWAYWKLNGVTPITLSSQEAKALEDANITCYAQIGSTNCTIGGKVKAGEWIDVIRFRDWQKNHIQQTVFSLFMDNTKVPYTDKGIALVHNAVLSSLKTGVANGGIIDSVEDTEGNVSPGYTVTVPKAREIPAEMRQKRILPGVGFSAHLTNAIHVTEISGDVNYYM